MNVKKLRGSLLLLLTAIIWGSSFVAQDIGVEYVESFTYNGIRMLIGAVVLVPVIALFCKKTLPDGRKAPDMMPSKREWLAGAVCGIILFVSSSLQQFGISFYSAEEAAAGKSGFITALYVVMVPVFGLFMHKKVPISVWIGIIIAVIGMYMLCMNSGLSLSLADLLVLLCAVMFSFHIIAIDHFSPTVSGIKMSAIQFLVCGILGIICMFIFESPSVDSILKAAGPILYSGVLSSGVAYTLQIIAQKDTDPTVASIIMSLESVFAAVTGALFGERLSSREILGCVLVFAAVLLAQLDFSEIKGKIKAGSKQFGKN